MRRMEKITGRSDDMMIVRGVNVFPTQIEEQILKVPALAPHYPDRAARARAAWTQMTVHVEAAPSGGEIDAAPGLRRRARPPHQEVDRHDHPHHVADPGGVARSQGKARRVIDNRRKM